MTSVFRENFKTKLHKITNQRCCLNEHQAFVDDDELISIPALVHLQKQNKYLMFRKCI